MRRLLPLVLLLAACGDGPQERPVADAGCPDRGGLVVPALPTADTTGRLVPEQTPDAALVCRYAPLAPGEVESGLLAESPLTGDLAPVPDDLAVPAALEGAGANSCGPVVDPVAPVLLRLAYDDGVVWVGALEQGDGCRGTTNGAVRSREDLGDVLVASAAAGRWTVPPLPDADQRCLPGRTGRRQQAGSLLPAGVTALTLCRVAGDGVTRRTATAQQLATVQDVLSEPVAQPQQPRVCQGGEQYELAAEYAAGPGVLLAYGSGCDPDVDNGSLQADLDPAGRARLEALLR